MAEKNRTARRIASASVLVVAVVFIAVSASEIAVAVFHEAPAHAAPETAAEVDCAARLERMEAALERGEAQAARVTLTQSSTDESRARAAFQAALAPEWDDQESAERLCSSSPRAKEAWAALLRLRRGLEGTARKDAHEIGPLRRDFETRLPRTPP